LLIFSSLIFEEIIKDIKPDYEKKLRKILKILSLKKGFFRGTMAQS